MNTPVLFCPDITHLRGLISASFAMRQMNLFDEDDTSKKPWLAFGSLLIDPGFLHRVPRAVGKSIIANHQRDFVTVLE